MESVRRNLARTRAELEKHKEAVKHLEEVLKLERLLVEVYTKEVEYFEKKLNKKYYYMNLGGMFTTVKATDKPLKELPSYMKEITKREYEEFIRKDFDDFPNID